MEATRILLDAADIPTHWYNVAADLPTPLAPPLGPDGKPATPKIDWHFKVLGPRFQVFVLDERTRRTIEHGRRIGLHRIEGQVLTENQPMLQMCKALGFKQRESREEPGVSIVTLDLTRNDADPQPSA